MIRWKVVKSKDRGSCLLSKNCKYRKIYKKGKIVKAKKGTLGIFCFKTENHAISFSKIIDFWNRGSFSIIKVRSIGKGKAPKFICVLSLTSDTENIFNKFYRYFKSNGDSSFSTESPIGTICYPAVKVLE